MSLKTIAGQNYEDVCVFQSDNGGIYVAMWDVKDVWPVIDQAKGATVEAIYTESGRDTVQQYPDKGDNASLITIINNTLGRF